MPQERQPRRRAGNFDPARFEQEVAEELGIPGGQGTPGARPGGNTPGATPATPQNPARPGPAGQPGNRPGAPPVQPGVPERGAKPKDRP